MTIVEETEFTNDYPAGTIISQDIDPGTVVDENDVITVTIAQPLDADNDGLLSEEDPDDHNEDVDGDGILDGSDEFPENNDHDDDGMADNLEPKGCVENADCDGDGLEDGDPREEDVLVPAERCVHDTSIYAFETEDCNAQRPCIHDESILDSDEACMEPVSKTETAPPSFTDSIPAPPFEETPLNTDDVLKEINVNTSTTGGSLPTTGSSSLIMLLIALTLVGFGGILFSTSRNPNHG